MLLGFMYGASSGLYIRSRNSDLIRVRIPVHNVAFQIGETAQVQSGGLLQVCHFRTHGHSTASTFLMQAINPTSIPYMACCAKSIVHVIETVTSCNAGDI